MSQVATEPRSTATTRSNRDDDPSNDQALQIVSFHAGEIRLGIDIRHVQEINRLLEVTPVPGASPCIHGVVNLRGDVVTVLDLHKIFGLPPTETPDACRNVVLRVGGERIGIMVDQVSDILSIRPEELSGRPSNIRNVDRQFIDSVYLHENDIIVLLNAEQLIEAINSSEQPAA